ncbi:MAG: UvrD-helicase domain-containing protein [Verrucomicrobiota bacterium]
MASPALRFSHSQRRLIQLRGNVLVVAGAGTGKTRTLVNRCVEWLLESPNKNSLDQLLIVTFTDAAAAEVRQRIREELRSRIESDPGAGHLTEQLALLETAFICTLHSFCFRLIRQHFFELGLDPLLTILPEEDAILLAQDTLSAILERHYKGENPKAKAIQHLVQTYGRGRDNTVRSLLIRLHHYTQTLPDPTGWLRSQSDFFRSSEPSRWRQWLELTATQWKNEWLPVVGAFDRQHPVIAACQAALESLPAKPEMLQFRRVLERIHEADRSAWPHGSKRMIREELHPFFAEVEFLAGLTSSSILPPECRQGPADASDDALKQDWNWARFQMLAAIDLVQEFERELARAKRDLGVLDFHDLEQFALRLLWDNEKSEPTDLAAAWRERLRLIFVDEYQDINAAQDAILLALGGDGPNANRFLVGDPKQSIYRFRLADPRIFQRYTHEWQGERGRGEVVALQENFRSRKPILDFVNCLFADVMKPGIGGVAYDETAWLQFGDAENRSVFGANGAAPGEVADRERRLVRPVEVHLVLTGKGPGENASEDESEASEELIQGATPTEREAYLIGLRLRELREQQTEVWDLAARAYRRVEWRDMVVLLRSPQKKVEEYAKEFTRLGIPLLASRGAFLDQAEVSDFLSLLALLDNPLQDISLLAVLRSPIAAFTLDELGLIRLARKGRFWTALEHFHRELSPVAGQQDPGSRVRATAPRIASALARSQGRLLVEACWVKVDKFLRQFERWRRLVRETSLSSALDQILRETNYTAFSAPGHTPQQRANLAKLLHWARRFDQFQRQGLFRFLKFIEAQREAEIDHVPAPVETADAVRLMSIHQSKGLEFNVVVLADLGKHFNLVDLKADIILDEEYGLSPLIKAPFSEQPYPSLPYWLAQRRQRQELLGEEMRLMYVAVTRACQSLILFGTATHSAHARWAGRIDFSERHLLAANSCLDWLGPWLVKNSPMQWPQAPAGRAPLFDWVTYQNDRRFRVGLPFLPNGPGPSSGTRDDVRPDLAQLKARLSWSYPFQSAVRQAAKVSVSAIRAGILASLPPDEIAANDDDDPLSPARPGNRRLGAADVGNAHHTFLQLVSLNSVHDPVKLQAAADQMVQEGMLSLEQARALDLQAVHAFWSSDVGREILGRREQIERELPFTMRLGLEEARQFQQGQSLRLQRGSGAGGPQADAPSLPPGEDEFSAGDAVGVGEHDYLVVTGVVDLLVLAPSEIWLLDFKTDYVTEENWQQKASAYQPQMQLYARALRRIYGRPVTRCWLHFLRLQRSVPCVIDLS